MENELNQVKLIIFYSLIGGENYNGLLDTLNAMGYRNLSDHELAVLLKTIKFYLQFRNNHRELASFNLLLKILLDMFAMINESISIEYTTVNYRIFNNSFTPYLNYNYNQLSQLLNEDGNSYIINSNPNRLPVFNQFPLNQVYLTALDNYLEHIEGPVDSDSDEESDCDSDEDSDCDSHKSKTNINILDNVVANINIEDLLDVNNTIKIINFDEALNATTGEDINIENDSESIDDSLGDSDSDSESDDDSDDDGEKTNNINLTQISNDSQLFNPELLKVIDISTISDESIKEKNDSNIDYKKMSLNKLRDIIVSKKLVTDPSKLKKNEMLKLLGSE